MAVTSASRSNGACWATWVLPALDTLVQAGLLIELVVDDQDFTHDWLREGAVLGCVSTVAQALRGCSVLALGAMRYIAVASPGFIATTLPQGLHEGNFAQVPFIVFNRKDDNHAVWVGQAFGVQEPRLVERHVPSTEAQTRAAVMGWGVAVVPELMAAPGLAGRPRAITVAAFIAAIEQGATISPSGTDGLIALQLADAALESVRTGKRVTL